MTTTTKEIKSRLNKDQFLEKILQCLFAAVGRRHTRQATATPDWFRTSSWTPKQERDFRHWLARECQQRYAISKRRAELEAGMFLLCYGWRIEEKNIPGQNASTLPRAVSTRRRRANSYAKTKQTNQKRNET